MQIQRISNNQNFGMKFRLSQDTIKHAENVTGLSYSEMTRTSLKDTTERMKQRGTLKKTNLIKEFFSDIYKKIGEKIGLLKKEHNFYTDID